MTRAGAIAAIPKRAAVWLVLASLLRSVCAIAPARAKSGPASTVIVTRTDPPVIATWTRDASMPAFAAMAATMSACLSALL